MKLAKAICYVSPPANACRGQSHSIRRFSNWLIAGFAAFAFISSVSAQTLVKPNADNTGPTVSESALKPYTGPTSITTAGTVIEGVIIKNQINVLADNVTIRNFVIRTSDYYGIQSINGAKNLLIENGLIDGVKSAGIYGSNFTAKRNEIRNSGADGIKAESNFLIESNWLHQLGYIETAHADGVQMVQGKNGIIRGNFFDMIPGADGFKNSQCMMISTNNGIIDNIKIEKNWINGGGFSIQIREKSASGFGVPTNMSVVGNRFGRSFQFGIWKFDGPVFTDLNVWDDTSALVPDQKGTGISVSVPVLPPVQTATPTATPASGAFLKPQLVKLASATAGSAIYFTTDGSTPTKQSTRYAQPILIDSTSELKAAAFVDGQTPSYIAFESYEFNRFEATEDWTNLTMDAKDRAFTVIAEITPKASSVDVVFGVANGPSESYADMATIVRFSTTGVIDARHGANYKADQVFQYVAGQKYSMRMVVDPTSKTYSVYIATGAGDWLTIAESYSFRSEQATVGIIDNVTFRAIGTGATVEAITFGGAPQAPHGLKLQVL